MKRQELIPVLVLGAGQIGRAMAWLLQQSGAYRVTVADRDEDALAAMRLRGHPVHRVDDDASVQAALAGQQAVLNALPFHRAADVAALAVYAGVHYFDLTEDVASTNVIRAMAAESRAVLMPQCGLAPGFIGVVGQDLANRFDELHTLRLRVGALPRYPTNRLGYNLTWSTEGLINEYCNPCDAIVDGQAVKVPALDGLEHLTIDGMAYEAFHTSGGLASLTQTLAGRAQQLDYKSLRYPGHRDLMKLLLDDLKLREQRDLLRQLLEQAIPATGQDVVVVFATATGRRAGRLMQESFCTRVVNQVVEGEALSAIQLTTAAGICCALDLVMTQRLPQRGFVAPEQIALPDWLDNRFGRRYLPENTPGQTATANREALA